MKRGINLIFGFLSFTVAIAQTYTQPLGSGVSNTATTCGGTWYDNGGAAGQYNNGQASSYCFTPAVAGQYASVTFTAVDIENGFDNLYIFDGTGGALLTTVTGTPATPFTVTAANSTGILCCTFVSDGTVRRPGWTATNSCSVTPGTPPVFTNSSEDCMNGGGTTVCGDQAFSGNSSGAGAINDLPTAVNGCLTGENQSSWYYFSPDNSGTIEFLISPSNGTDDYDFALYGPFTQVSCPWNTMAQPLRCSYAAGGGTTGLVTGSGDNSEGIGGNRYVNQIAVTAGQVYVLVVDNFTSSAQPFTLDWTLSGGASLDCATLPIELISFNGFSLENNTHLLKWTTASETNNDFFTIEKSNGVDSFESIGEVDGSGSINQAVQYSFIDENPFLGFNYYRIRQTDFNGDYSYSPILMIENSLEEYVGTIYPNPSENSFNLQLDASSDDVKIIRMSDVSGKIIREEQVNLTKGSNTISISVNTFQSGIYFVQIINSKGELISCQKLIKE